MTASHAPPHEALGPLEPALGRRLDALDSADVCRRIWARDPSVWGRGPTEVVDRLGWLGVSGVMLAQVPALEAFAEGARRDGVEDAVLLGMGGSSLGAEMLRTAFEQPGDRPRLSVLDSTVPAWFEAVRERIDLERALFLVASKSGTTAEVTSLFELFWQAVDAGAGGPAGQRFVAVTDPATPLADLASERGFRATFLNPPDIGGRFSVLSYFGLVPAALLGIDLGGLLGRAEEMAAACRSDRPAAANPGLRLGALLGAAAGEGRDKLTFLTTPRLADFGLWAEQLIAESTGKEGRGILPIAGEPAVDTERYRDDRLFVALRLADDDVTGLDRRVERLAAAGLPHVVFDLASTVDLGGEIFRWMFATAVAGHLLDVHPFDQPNVESTKRLTRSRLAAFGERGGFEAVEPGPNLAAALAEGPEYVALMAYLAPSAALETAVRKLRGVLLETRGVATTFGYAPRMLHSTGQLHKGGPPGGLYVQLLADDLPAGPPIPGQVYGLGTLARAQADGDLEALRESGRVALRIELSGDPAAALDAIAGRLA